MSACGLLTAGLGEPSDSRLNQAVGKSPVPGRGRTEVSPLLPEISHLPVSILKVSLGKLLLSHFSAWLPLLHLLLRFPGLQGVCWNDPK